jgi:ferrochelatase
MSEQHKKKKVAVILFNLGGPDKPESIAPYLKNFFMDPLILRMPKLPRMALSSWISYSRTKGAAGTSYAALGGSSPLLANTNKQAKALEDSLALADEAEYKTFVCMRYWHPMSEEVAKNVSDYAPDHIVLMTLYPQYSTTTTKSSYRDWYKAAEKSGLNIPTSAICCYPRDYGFIAASAQKLKAAYYQLMDKTDEPPRILFSAHGLPQNIIEAGDPYQWQCEETARQIIHHAELQHADWVVCYQSRVGRLKWIGPSTEEEVLRAGADQKSIVIYPHAFVSEHVETLVEIEEEYRELAEYNGVLSFVRVETVGTDQLFIDGLAMMVRSKHNQVGTTSNENNRICPSSSKECCLESAP